MSTKTHKENLREEWKKEYYKPEGYIVPPEFIEQNVNHIFDWFSSRTIPIQSLLSTIEKMGGMKKDMTTVFYDETGYTRARAEGFNQALALTIQLLTQLIEENK